MANITIISASEAVHIPSYSEFKPRLTRKTVKAVLTETEQRVLAMVGTGLDLGHVSFPLLYSRALSISRTERNALFNLIYNGRLELTLTSCPTTYALQPVAVENKFD